MTWDQVALLVLKLTVLLGLAWAGTALMRRASAAFRHLIWTSAIAASLLLPALTWVIPAWKVPVVTRTVSVMTARVVPEEPVVTAAPQAPVRPAQAPVSAAPGAIPESTEPLANSQVDPAPIDWAMIAIGIWLSGCVVLGLRLALGLWRLRAMRLHARPLELPAQLPEAPRARRIELLESASSNSMPLTWGWRNPRILLPAGFETWSPERLRLVLAHEAAHVERRDWPVQILGELARAVYWFHPLVWVALWHLRQESERAADDRVLASGFDGPGYAHHLIEIARLHQNPFGTSAATLAMARPSTFERRLTAMLNPKVSRSPLSLRQMLLTLGAAFVVLLPLATAIPAQRANDTLLAQNTPPLPPPPPAQSIQPDDFPAADAVTMGTGPFEIRGALIEPGVDHPIVGADVTIYTEIHEPRRPIQRVALQTVQTNAQGRFRFRPDQPGAYVINTEAEGYARSPLLLTNPQPNVTMFGGFQATVRLSEEAPSVELAFSLVRSGEITGTLVDAETGEPVSGAQIIAVGYSGNRNRDGGAFGVGPIARRTKSGRDGRFVIPNVTPNRYVLQVLPAIPFQNRVSGEFTEDDAAAVDLDYSGSDWVRGMDPSGLFPIEVFSGGSVSAGTVRAEKMTYYRARVTVDNADCNVSEDLSVAHYEFAGATQRLYGTFDVPCDHPFLVRLLRPGQSFLEVSQGKAGERRRVTVPLVVNAENLDLHVALAPGVDLSGSVTIAEGGDPTALQAAMGVLVLGIRPIGGIPYIEDVEPIHPNSDGEFSALNHKPGEQRVTLISGLPPEHYVQEIRYNGVPIDDDFFTLNPGAAAQNLEIVIDNRPASLTGSVQTGSRAAAQADVLLVRWPASEFDLMRSVTQVDADSNGRYALTGIVPGEYRVLAVPASQKSDIDKVGVLERLLPHAEEIVLERGNAATLNFKTLERTR